MIHKVFVVEIERFAGAEGKFEQTSTKINKINECYFDWHILYGHQTQWVVYIYT